MDLFDSTYRGFVKEQLSDEDIRTLEDIANKARGDILTMTTVAKSGHPGGSMSSIEIYLTLYGFANLDPKDPRREDGDRIVISYGHTSPGAYSALAATGFIERDKLIGSFRAYGSDYEGHVERHVPGIAWSSGNLGQGLSAGCGFALAARLKGNSSQIYVMMSDGEQQKGQVSEARRFAKKYHLDNLTVVIDHNGIQLSGPLENIMPQDIEAGFVADGWHVKHVNGHDFGELYGALRDATTQNAGPVMIMAKTTMGKNVSFMEDDFHYHGAPLDPQKYRAAMLELSLEDELDRWQAQRDANTSKPRATRIQDSIPMINKGSPKTYAPDDMTDNRSGFGTALADLAQANRMAQPMPIAVFDCDLEGSTKTDGFAKAAPKNFFQAGVQEHNTATIAGALSTEGFCTYYADFGVFGLDETYNQHRLNDINETNLKLVLTHCGVDVGEDGKTHQCIDYIGHAKNLIGYKILVPADPNQTDRAVRYVADKPGNWIIAMGRSKTPVVATLDGDAAFGGDYNFIYGKIDELRPGSDGAIFVSGSLAAEAVEAWPILKEKGLTYAVYHVACPNDLDEEIVIKAAKSGIIVSFEDHLTETGLSASLDGVLVDRGLTVKRVRLGVEAYCSSGPAADIKRGIGLDAKGLIDAIMDIQSQ